LSLTQSPYAQSIQQADEVTVDSAHVKALAGVVANLPKAHYDTLKVWFDLMDDTTPGQSLTDSFISLSLSLSRC